MPVFGRNGLVDEKRISRTGQGAVAFSLREESRCRQRRLGDCSYNGWTKVTVGRAWRRVALLKAGIAILGSFEF
jgi:hypothetical protein